MKTAKSSILRHARSFIGCAFTLVATSIAANSAPLWNIDLDAMPKDATIETTSYVIGVVNTKPQTVGAGSVVIRDDFTVSTTTLPGHSVVLTKPTTGTGTASATRFTMIGNAADYTATTDYELRFDVLLSESAFTTSTSLNVRLINDNSSTSVGALIFKQNGTLDLNSAFAETKSIASAWNWGEVLHLTLQVDATNNRFNVIINGALVGFLDLDNTSAPNPNLGVNRIWFGANSDNSTFAGGIGISNIETFNSLSPVPEPSPVALVLGAVAFLFFQYYLKRGSLGR